MDKIDLPERPDWRDEAEKLGFSCFVGINLSRV